MIFLEKFSNGFGWRSERRIFLINHHLSNNGHALPCNTLGCKLIVYCLLDLIADGALGICHDVYQGNKVEAGCLTGNFRPPHNESHLGPVAMGYQNLVSLTYEINYMLYCFANRLMLILDGLLLFAFDQRITTNGDEC